MESFESFNAVIIKNCNLKDYSSSKIIAASSGNLVKVLVVFNDMAVISLYDITANTEKYLCRINNIMKVPNVFWPYIITVANNESRIEVFKNLKYILSLKIGSVATISISINDNIQKAECKVAYIGKVDEIGEGTYFGLNILNIADLPEFEQTSFLHKYFDNTKLPSVIISAEYFYRPFIIKECRNTIIADNSKSECDQDEDTLKILKLKQEIERLESKKISKNIDHQNNAISIMQSLPILQNSNTELSNNYPDLTKLSSSKEILHYIFDSINTEKATSKIVGEVTKPLDGQIFVESESVKNAPEYNLPNRIDLNDTQVKQNSIIVDANNENSAVEIANKYIASGAIPKQRMQSFENFEIIRNAFNQTNIQETTTERFANTNNRSPNLHDQTNLNIFQSMNHFEDNVIFDIDSETKSKIEENKMVSRQFQRQIPQVPKMISKLANNKKTQSSECSKNKLETEPLKMLDNGSSQKENSDHSFCLELDILNKTFNSDDKMQSKIEENKMVSPKFQSEKHQVPKMISKLTNSKKPEYSESTENKFESESLKILDFGSCQKETSNRNCGPEWDFDILSKTLHSNNKMLNINNDTFLIKFDLEKRMLEREKNMLQSSNATQSYALKYLDSASCQEAGGNQSCLSDIDKFDKKMDSNCKISEINNDLIKFDINGKGLIEEENNNSSNNTKSIDQVLEMLNETGKENIHNERNKLKSNILMKLQRNNNFNRENVQKNVQNLDLENKKPVSNNTEIEIYNKKNEVTTSDLDESSLKCIAIKNKMENVIEKVFKELRVMRREVQTLSADSTSRRNSTTNLDLESNLYRARCCLCYKTIKPNAGIRLARCHHIGCPTCFISYVKTFSTGNRITCPFTLKQYHCNNHLEKHEQQLIMNLEDVDKSLDKSNIDKKKKEKIVQCKSPQCDGIWLVEAGSNIFACPECEKYNCMNCDAIHSGQTCEEYKRDPTGQIKLSISSTDSWTCKTCTFINETKKNFCVMCGKTKYPRSQNNKSRNKRK